MPKSKFSEQCRMVFRRHNNKASGGIATQAGVRSAAADMRAQKDEMPVLCREGHARFGWSACHGNLPTLTTVAALFACGLAMLPEVGHAQTAQPETLATTWSRYYWNGASSNPATSPWVGGSGSWDLTRLLWANSPDPTAARAWPSNGAIAVFGGQYYSRMTLATDIHVSGFEIQLPSLGWPEGNPAGDFDGTTFAPATSTSGGSFIIPRGSNLVIDSTNEHPRETVFSVDIADAAMEGFFPPAPSTVEIKRGEVRFQGRKSYLGHTVVDPGALLTLVPDATSGTFPALAGGVTLKGRSALLIQFLESEQGYPYPFTLPISVVGEDPPGDDDEAQAAFVCAAGSLLLPVVNIVDNLKQYLGELTVNKCVLNLQGTATVPATIVAAQEAGGPRSAIFTLAGTGTVGLDASRHNLAQSILSPGPPSPANTSLFNQGEPGYLLFNGDLLLDDGSLINIDIAPPGTSNGFMDGMNFDYVAIDNAINIKNDNGPVKISVNGAYVGTYAIMQSEYININDQSKPAFLVQGSDSRYRYTTFVDDSGPNKVVKITITQN
ncbi:hypothetical protein [Martelella sp. FOR1707]